MNNSFENNNVTNNNIIATFKTPQKINNVNTIGSVIKESPKKLMEK